jgi:hypothetical protein
VPQVEDADRGWRREFLPRLLLEEDAACLHNAPVQRHVTR